MSVATIRDEVLTRLAALVGLRLAVAGRAADMAVFRFGRAPASTAEVELALHVQCAWRIDGPDGIVTGRADLWQPADPDAVIGGDTWDHDVDPNLQDRRLRELLGDESGERPLLVESIDADHVGGLTLALSGGYRLVAFPHGTRSEDWRLFRPGDRSDHFVVTGGRIE